VLWAALAAGCGGPPAGTPPDAPEGATAPAPPASPAGAGPAAGSGAAANVAPAVAEEVLRGGGKVYVRVLEGQWDFWVVAPEIDVKPGDHLLLGKGPLRKQVDAPEVGRSFAELIELPALQVVDAGAAKASLALAPPPGGRPIADVYRDRQALSGKPVKVRGRVVKASKGIFGANWYHLQDGSGVEADGTHDLTVTSQADLSVGDVAVAEGALTLDKDLGFGYFYACIIEDGAVVKE
jgi:hypothetical protein